MQQVNADRRDMSDHSWVHIQIVVNIALRLFRLLDRAGVEPAMVAEHGMRARDAEVVIAAACLFHDTGMSIHRTDHEQYSPVPGRRPAAAAARGRSTRSPS